MKHFDPTRGYNGSVQSYRPLTDDDLHEMAPSIFASAPHDSRSDRYALIPTSAVVQGLRNEGYEPYHAQQGNSRIPGKANFTKHMIRFRREGWDKAEAQVGNSIHELVLLNSHDGTSAYRLMSGVFRLLCLNGLIVGKTYEDVRVGHTGDAVKNVIEGSYTVLEQHKRIEDSIDDMSRIVTSETQRRAFGVGARALRYGEGVEDREIDPLALVTPRRYEDKANDLWTVMNRAQENLIRGGFVKHSFNEQGRRTRRAEARPVNGIDQSTEINRGVWAMAEYLREQVA